MKVIRQMQLDQDKVMPNERQRHWLLAQSHIQIRDGGEDLLKHNSEILERLQIRSSSDFHQLSESDKQRAKQAYDAIKSVLVEQKDFHSDNLLDSYLQEKAFMFDEVSIATHRPDICRLKCGPSVQRVAVQG
jgi:hypothetical protein